MNRPLWLDLFYVAGFFAPPVVVAAGGAIGLSNWLELPGWAAVLIFMGSVIILIILWVIGLIAWNRIVSPQVKEDPGTNRNGN